MDLHHQRVATPAFVRDSYGSISLDGDLGNRKDGAGAFFATAAAQENCPGNRCGDKHTDVLSEVEQVVCLVGPVGKIPYERCERSLMDALDFTRLISSRLIAESRRLSDVATTCRKASASGSGRRIAIHAEVSTTITLANGSQPRGAA
jgi:hypothetical protein